MLMPQPYSCVRNTNSVCFTLAFFLGFFLLPVQMTQAWQTPSSFWKVSSTGFKASLRGLDICEDGQTIWACGSNSTVIRSEDLGGTWKSVSPAGYDKLEFRSIVAWDRKKAMIASAGSPAVVLLTDNGGETWREILKRTEEKAFFDALKFFNPTQGVVFSDPVDGKWLILTTNDQGQSWNEVPRASIPPLKDGEAAFAASNSALHLQASGQAWIGTGGIKAEQSRVYLSQDFGQTWSDSYCPIPSGEAAGIFSIASSPKGRVVAVGGDYRPDQSSLHTAAYSDDNGQTWRLANREPASFRSSIVSIPNTNRSNPAWIATGPSGTDVSDDGSIWKNVSETGFHVLAVHSNGTVVAVGSEGRFGIVKSK